MALVLDWKKKLGYKKDPFLDEPYMTGDLVGLPKLKERVNLFLIKNERLGIVVGDPGMGKSTILDWVDFELTNRPIKPLQLGGKDFSSRDKLFVALYKQTVPFIERQVFSWQKRKPEELLKTVKEKLIAKHHLLLIDDAGSMNSAQLTLLDELMLGTQLTVIAADVMDRIKNFKLKHQPELKYKIQPYAPEQLVEMLRLRIEAAKGVELFPFKEKQLAKLSKDSHGNPRDFLALAKELAIELSLKVEGPPKPVPVEKPAPVEKSAAIEKSAPAEKPAPEKGSEKEAKPHEKRFGFLKIQYSDQETPKETPKLEEIETPHNAPTVPVSQEAAVDAALLAEMVKEVEPQKTAPKPVKSDEIIITEDLIHNIAQDVAKKSPHKSDRSHKAKTHSTNTHSKTSHSKHVIASKSRRRR